MRAPLSVLLAEAYWLRFTTHSDWARTNVAIWLLYFLPPIRGALALRSRKQVSEKVKD